jgi:ferredoxin
VVEVVTLWPHTSQLCHALSVFGRRLCRADCDTCRWMAPNFYKRANEQSAVLAQPETDEDRLEANKALLACPT